MLDFSMQGILGVLFSLVGIAIAWYALGSVRWEALMRRPADGPARVLRLIIAILLGMQLASFFMNYLNDTMWLRHMNSPTVKPSGTVPYNSKA